MSEARSNPVTTITPYKDGPYLIRGDFQLIDRDGQTIPVSRRTVALCRCGKSRIRPFCDGTHKLTGFRAPASADAAPADPAIGLGSQAPGERPPAPDADE